MHPGQVRPALPRGPGATGGRSERSAQPTWLGRAGRGGWGCRDHRPVSARLFCALPQRWEGRARGSGSRPPCACGLIQTKKRLYFVFLPRWELISGRLPSGDVFLVKCVKGAEQSAHAVTEGKLGGMCPRQTAGAPRTLGPSPGPSLHGGFPSFLALSKPPSAQRFSFAGPHSQDDFTHHEFSLS